MSTRGPRTSFLAAALVGITVLAGGCSWNGVNSLPLPGTVGNSSGDYSISVQVANVGTLSQNSPVLINDVEVGSIGEMKVRDWQALVELRLKKGTVVPGNAVAKVGQTSLLGSMHIALDPPAGEAPVGTLPPGSTIPLKKSSSYPSTEQTLAAVSTVVNGGGLGQLGEIITSINSGLVGNEADIRQLLRRLSVFVGTLDRQRGDLVELLSQTKRLSTSFADQDEVISTALNKIPPALAVLDDQAPKLTTALTKLKGFSDTTTAVINQVRDDLLTDLEHLEPTLRSLADVGPQINKAIAYGLVYPYGQRTIDRAVRGDYINLHATVDLTVPRLKKELLLGTPLGDPTETIAFAPGDPGYKSTPTHNPLFFPITRSQGGGR
ncbi:MCE family protein [Gordonia pseudamarae]|jgi:phospholipid/cholesterol/gamma-HCH transport system substrate-binding protein|uniref:MCE family protein n=1 Tax=Gordonia pseudamarae TaxID=2831662 RepID=A0ABX6IEG6_9ACTN|nr:MULTISPECIES: MCE family protein [Gordonia]MBD0021715.1 MCE family protein [Gordonia sp. (in: high G+C Gram-positive bacteria)]QHN25310.1 MCE family protein [Gordonia pseudamarae]QHN34242.1 MCE family protein [Gordonia pseudamarae]